MVIIVINTIVFIKKIIIIHKKKHSQNINQITATKSLMVYLLYMLNYSAIKTLILMKLKYIFQKIIKKILLKTF